MLRKFAALLMITAFTHVSAMTPIARTAELNKTFDELNYSLNVEWDQKDEKFFDASIDDFEKKIAELQKEGMSNKELIEYTMSKIKDKKTKDEVHAIVEAVNGSDMNSDEARAFVMTKLSKTYANGASWSGGRVGLKLALLLGIILIICLCSGDGDDTPNETPNETPTEPEYPTYPEYPCYESAYWCGPVLS